MWYLVKTPTDKYSIRYYHTEDAAPYRSLRNDRGVMWASSIGEFTKSELNHGESYSIQCIREELGDNAIIPLSLITDPDAPIEVFHSTYPEFLL